MSRPTTMTTSRWPPAVPTLMPFHRRSERRSSSWTASTDCHGSVSPPSSRSTATRSSVIALSPERHPIHRWELGHDLLEPFLVASVVDQPEMPHRAEHAAEVGAADRSHIWVGRWTDPSRVFEQLLKLRVDHPEDLR